MPDHTAPHMLGVSLKTSSLPRRYSDGWYAFTVTLYGPNPAFGRDPMAPERIALATLPDREGIALIREATPGVLVNQMLVRWQDHNLPLVFDAAAGNQYEVLTRVFPERDPYARLRPNHPATARRDQRRRVTIALLVIALYVLARVLLALLGYVPMLAR